jgi:YfiH family protein
LNLGGDGGRRIAAGYTARTMLQPRFAASAAGDLRYYVSPLLQRLGVPHAFSTRTGGVSPPPFDSLNLGIAGDADVRDSSDNLEENYSRLRAAVGCSDLGRCWVTQVHGADVCDVRIGSTFENGIRADALVSNDPTRVLSVKYADCVPLLLASANGRAVAAVHAGWRGLVAGVIGAAVRQLERTSGSAAASFVAAVGPCIGFDAFEVGPEVLAAFERRMGPAAPIRNGEPGKGHVDLRQAALIELQSAGLSIDRIDTTDRCTFSHPDEFFSHRRDGNATGRMAAIISPAGQPR